jgi:hypothetical protein
MVGHCPNTMFLGRIEVHEELSCGREVSEQPVLSEFSLEGIEGCSFGTYRMGECYVLSKRLVGFTFYGCRLQECCLPELEWFCDLCVSRYFIL